MTDPQDGAGSRPPDGPAGPGASADPLSSALAEEIRAARPSQPLGAWWLAVLGVAVAALLLLTQDLRFYGYALGATLAVLALLRAALPARLAGGLVVRSRWIDVVTLLLLGGSVAVLARVVRLG